MNRLRRCLVILAAAICCIFPAPDARAGQVVMASPYWAGFTSPDGQGLYHDLLQAVFAPRGDTVRHLEVPAKRGLIMLKEGQVDIYTCRPFAPDGLQLAGLPMYEGEYHALFLTKSFPAWNGVSTLADRSLVWRLGYYSPRDFPVPVRYAETTTGTEALNRVVHGTAEFYIDDRNLILETLKSYTSHLDAREYRIESVGFRPYYPVFAASPRGDELRAAFEEGMRRLAREGALRPIYEKWGLPMPRVYAAPAD